MLFGLALHLIPPLVLAECRQRADDWVGRPRPSSRIAAFVIFMIWLFMIAVAAWWTYNLLGATQNPT